MGGCCCHSDDTKEEDGGEEKCIIVAKDVDESPKKEYGAVSTKDDDDEELYPDQDRDDDEMMDKCHEAQISTEDVDDDDDDDDSNTDDKESNGGMSEDRDATGEEHQNGDVHASHEDVTTNHQSDSSSSDSSSRGDNIDDEIDQLVEAAMAAKVVYPPAALTVQSERLRSPYPRGPTAESPTRRARHERAGDSDSDDDDDDDDDETFNGRQLSLMKKTQMSFNKVKERAKTMITVPSKSREDVQREKRTPDETTKYKQDKRSTSTSAGNWKKSAGGKKYNKMKSSYAKDRVAQFEVERKERDKQAAKRSGGVDPRKAALERGQRLGELDDATDAMREQSTSFADTARRLREHKRNRTSTFPW